MTQSTIQYSITFEAGALLNISAGINEQVMPLMSQAVNAIAQQAKINWAKAIHGASLWSAEKDAYMQSIKMRETGPFSAVVESDYQYAWDIENGRPPRDLKKMLNTSMKVRRTESGKRFLVIPFRYNTAGHNALAQAVPTGVQSLAASIAPSRITTVGQRPSGQVTHLSPKSGMTPSQHQSQYLSNPKTQGASMVARNQYAWGGRITAAMLKANGASAQEVKRYAGMVRMDTSTPGGAKSSALMTFRVMMEGSPKWIVPAKPGLFLARRVQQELQPKAQAAFQEAIKRTLGGGQ